MAIPDRYLMDAEWIASAIQTSEEIDTAIKSAFQSSCSIYTQLENTALWTGRAKDEFQVYYNLLLQYHALLVDGSSQVPDATGKGASDYPQRATDALRTWQKNMSSFCENSETFREIEGIK